MALDEPRDSTTFQREWVSIIIDKEFYEESQTCVTVDFMGYGFRINSSINLAPAQAAGLPRVLQHRQIEQNGSSEAASDDVAFILICGAHELPHAANTAEFTHQDTF